MEPEREVILAPAMQRYDEGLRNFCKSQGNKSAMWYGQAARDVTDAIRIDPTLARAYRLRAACFTALGENAQADADRSRLRELESEPSYRHPADRSTAQIHCRKAVSDMSSSGLISDSLYHLQKAIDADPTFSEADDMRSDIYTRLGMADEALADIRLAGELKR